MDIVDCNAGNHGKAFATNFNPEINIREVTAPGRYWENGEWVETSRCGCPASSTSRASGRAQDATSCTTRSSSRWSQQHQGLKRIRFWMTFGDDVPNPPARARRTSA